MEQRQYLQHRPDRFCQLRGRPDRAGLDRIYREVRDSAYEIIRRKGATYYGIAMAVTRIAECVVRDERAMLPVSVLLQGQYGLDGLVSASPPSWGGTVWSRCWRSLWIPESARRCWRPEPV